MREYCTTARIFTLADHQYESGSDDDSGSYTDCETIYPGVAEEVLEDPTSTEEGEWDAFQQNLSFTEDSGSSLNQLPPPFVFSLNTEENFAVWPPRHLSEESEPDLFQGQSLFDQQRLEPVLEADVASETAEMPPRENATACHANFVEEIDEWNEEIAFVKNRNKIDQDKLDELKEIKNSVIEAAKKLKRLDPNYAESYPDVEPAKTKVRNDLEDMKELLNTCQQKPPETPIDKDDQIQALILQLSAELQFFMMMKPRLH